MANSIINSFNRSILNGDPIFKDYFAPFQLKSWLYFKGYILSREEFAHAPIAPWNNQEGDPLGEPLTYLPNPYFCGQMYNNGDPDLTSFEMLKRNVYIFWSKWQILRSKGYCLKYNVTINGIHYDMVLFCEKNRLLTEISEEIIGFVYRADNSSLLKPPQGVGGTSFLGFCVYPSLRHF